MFLASFYIYHVEALRKGLSVKKKKNTPEWRDRICDPLQILNCGCDLFNYRSIKLVTYTIFMCLNRSCTQCVCEKYKRSNITVTINQLPNVNYD